MQINQVQTFIAKKLVHALSDKTDANISVNKVAIRFFDNVQLENVYLEDLDKDTLLYIGKLIIDINLFYLLKKEINLDQLLLQDAVINLKQYAGDGTFNFQFLIDAFSSGTSAKDKSSQSDWKFGANRIDFNTIRADIDLAPSGFNLQGYIGTFSVTAEKLDLSKQEINLDQIKLHDSRIAMAISSGDTSTPALIDSLPSAYLIPDIGWVLTSNFIDFRNNMVALDDKSTPSKKEGFDPAHFQLTDISIQLQNVLFGKHTVKGYIQKTTARDISGLQLKELSADVTIDTAGIDIHGLSVRTADSFLEAELNANFPNLQSLVEVDDNLKLQANFQKSHLAVKDIAMFAPEQVSTWLADIENIYLDGNITGSIPDLTGENLNISIDEKNFADLNFHAVGLPELDTAFFELKINRLAFTPGMITKLTGTKMPVEVQRLGAIRLNGTYLGTIRDMKFDGTIKTALGLLRTDVHAQFNDDYTTASYEGDINVDRFRLSALLNDTSIGTITMAASVKGSGLTFEEIQADIQATIQEAEYRNYVYHNLNITGNVDGKKFSGEASMDDPNLKFDFQGLADISATSPIFSFEANLDTINLGRLNLMSQNVGISSTINADFEGSGLDDFQGFITIKHIHVSNDTTFLYMDSLKATAQVLESGIKEVELLSPVISATLTGNYNIADLPRLMVNYVNSYFPLELTDDKVEISAKLAKEIGPKRTVEDQSFSLKVAISNPLAIAQIFIPQLTQLDTAFLQGNFDSKEKSLDIHAFVPSITYASIKMDSIRFIAKGGSDDLTTSLTIDTIDINNQIKFPADFKAKFYDQQVEIAMKIAGDTASRLDFQGLVTRTTNESFRLAFQEKIVFNGENWDIPDENYIEYYPGNVFVNNLNIHHNQQQIRINSQSDLKGAPIDIAINHFDLSEVSDFLDNDSIRLNGVINGIVTIDDITGQLALTADLNINSIEANGHPVGNLELIAAWEGDLVAVDLLLRGEDNNLIVSGKVNPETNTINLNMNMKRLNLAVADPFFNNFIRNSKGYLSANIDIKGEMFSPDINGHIGFHDVSTHIVPANSRFTLPENNRIDISPEKFELNRFELRDQNNNKAILQGKVLHRKFMNYQLDLALDTDNFLFMNTTKKDNELFYGKIIMAINAKVKGNPKLPKVIGRAAAKAGTQVFINPMSGEETLEQVDYVVFAKPPFNDEKSDTTAEQPKYEVKISGIDMNLLFELTPESELQIIIDPISGDKLICRGKTELMVDISPAGGTLITGSYIVESGNYSFSYQGMMKRQFEVQQGSRINFSGDPLTASLDVTAIYEVEAATYELISSQSASLSDNDTEISKERIPVKVLLHIGGQVSSPELSFDIQITSQGDPVTSIAARQLSRIRQNPTELNKQVFALLLFRSFIAEEGRNPNLSLAGQNVALKSVSKLITSQLNKLTSRTKGFQINLDLDSYKSDYGETEGNNMTTQFQLDISKQLLNERLEIKVGTNLDVENSASGNQQQGASNITGDFIVEYKLTENGRYRIKVFQASDYDFIGQSTLLRTGIGISFKESFRQLIKPKKNDKLINKSENSSAPKQEN